MNTAPTQDPATQQFGLRAGKGQVDPWRAVTYTVGLALSSREYLHQSLVWGIGVGGVNALLSSSLRARLFGMIGALLMAFCIGYLAPVVWRIRLVPRGFASLKAILVANGLLALPYGYCLAFASYWLSLFLVFGREAFTEEALLKLALISCWGIIIPPVGFLIADGEDQERGKRRWAARMRRQRRLAEEARLVALRSQINPHFFFNALNTIASLIPTRPADAERAVELLAEALRPALMREQPMLAALSEEIRIAAAYLEIEKLRHGDRVRITMGDAGPIASIAVPSLSLQPLVENAFSHGVSQYTCIYNVELTFDTRDGYGIVEIRNHPASESSPPGWQALRPITPEPGHALHNIASRLRAHFGSAASLEVRCDGAGSAIARMTIPREPAP